jgi:type III secretion protein W
MVDRIDATPRPLQTDPLARAAQPAIVGKLRGQEVVEERDIASLVQDSLEEVGFSVSEQVESVDVQEVVVEDLSARIEDRIKKISRLKERIETARSRLDPAKLRELLKTLKQGGQQQSGDDVRKMVAERFADVTDQYAALDDLLDQLGHGQGSRELRRALEEASDSLWTEHSTDIVAGLNVAAVADRFAHGDVEQFQALRESYRQQVKERPPMPATLRNLRQRFGDDQLGERIKFLVAAAGHDLDAIVSSVDKEQLGDVVADLSRLQLISSMRAQAATIVGRLDKRFHVPTQKSEWDLLQDSVELMADKWVAAGKVETLGDQVAPLDLECRIYFLRELNAFFRNVPTKAYESLDVRERLLDASQEALDKAIEREEDDG